MRAKCHFLYAHVINYSAAEAGEEEEENGKKENVCCNCTQTIANNFKAEKRMDVESESGMVGSAHKTDFTRNFRRTNFNHNICCFVSLFCCNSHLRTIMTNRVKC